MWMKKIVCILFVFLLSLQLLPLAYAEGDPQILVSSTQQCQGSSMTLQVSIVNNPGYANISLLVLYDTAALKLTEIEKVNAPSMFVANAETGLISAAGMNNIHGDGVMFLLHFDVLTPGSHMVSVQLDAFGNADGQMLNAQVTEGKIQVGQHAYETQNRQPTCTEDGATVHTCAICGDVYESDPVPALGHQFDDRADVVCNTCGLDISATVPTTQPGTTKPTDHSRPGNAGNIWLLVALVLLLVMLTILIGMLITLRRRRRTEDNVPLPTLDEEDGYFDDEE